MIIKTKKPGRYAKYWNKLIRRYSSTRKVLENTFLTHCDNVWLTERRTSQDLRVGFMCDLLDLGNKCSLMTEISNGGGRLLLTGKGLPTRLVVNDFEVNKPVSPGYFTIATDTEPVSLWIVPRFHRCGDRSDNEKE